MHTNGLKSFVNYVAIGSLTGRISKPSIGARRFKTLPNQQLFPGLPSLDSRGLLFARIGHEQARSLWSKTSQPRVFSPAEEEAGKAAVLEKVMTGRQPTDLMLRCKSHDLGRGRLVNKSYFVTLLQTLTWIYSGNVKTISGHFKKSDLIAEHHLNPRDLRKIDSRVPNLVPTILVRKQAMLVNILHIRALIKADTVVLFDTYGSADSRLHSVYLYHLEHNLKSKGSGLPYEFRALESTFLSVLSALEAELVFIRTLVGGLLAELEDDIDHDRFKRLLHYSRRLASFQSRAKLVGEAIDEVLTQDEDMAMMYLTDKKNGVKRDAFDHEELELLLESFSKQVEEIVSEVGNLEANVQSTQEIVELILDSNRNALLALDLQVSIATFGVGTGALITGLLGMNLANHFETHPYAFYVMSGMAGLASFLVAYLGFRKLAKIRKVGLSRPSSQKSRRPWLPLPLRRRSQEGWF
ncbi:hypothetical protein D9757_002583 [Collybiopsis confluens]|uniref:Magnesium transporter n=1 Tax=Collybiopsis confluens TaxID=2823264 RepID=A0A8H5HWR1_9AGAR|nr:hypothetical protein D9757_002583 [Collybiopsis confluens]